MPFHSIHIQAGTKETGKVFPQVICISLESAHQLDSSDFSTSTPELIFKLNKGAKVTDIISQVAINAQGLLVSELFKSLLEEFNLMYYKLYPASIVTTNCSLNYYWLHLIDDGLRDDINYGESVFYYTKSTFKKDRISLSSYGDYLQKKAENGILWGAKATEIKLKDSFDCSLDLFVIMPFNYDFIISKRLATAIKEKAISGIDIKEAPFVHFEPLQIN